MKDTQNMDLARMDPSFLPWVPQVRSWRSGPEQQGSEWRYRVELVEGGYGVLATLAPELAEHPALRRRYVHSIRRLHALAVPRLCSPIAIGTGDDRSDQSEDASKKTGAKLPWRLRRDPRRADSDEPLPTLQAILDQRPRMELEAAVALIAAVAEVVQAIHEQGTVLRDFAPSNVLVEDRHEPSRVWLSDVGLSQVDRLSTQSAASLMLKHSVYTAPEQLLRIMVDPRSDIYTLGVMLFVALSGELPFDEGAGLVEQSQPPPRLRALRAEVPPALEELVDRCLCFEPQARPASASEFLAVLRGETSEFRDLERIPCQNCGALMPKTQRLCLQCGKQGVLLSRAGKDNEPWVVELSSFSAKGDEHRRFVEIMKPLVNENIDKLHFAVGEANLYSEAEKEKQTSVPANLFDDIDQQSAQDIARRLQQANFAVRIAPKNKLRVHFSRRQVIGAIIGQVLVMAFLAFMYVVFGAGELAILGMCLLFGSMIPLAFVLCAVIGRFQIKRRIPVFFLRRAPAALPASDPWVARLASWLSPDKKLSEDLKKEVGEMALLVQRLVDHRASFKDPSDAAQMQWVTEPVAELVERLDALLKRLSEIEAALAKLDENTLIRAIAQSQAREEPESSRTSLLLGMDRLGELRHEHSALFGRLLESGALLRRAVNLGLRVRDEQVEHEREVQKALQMLSAPPALSGGE